MTGKYVSLLLSQLEVILKMTMYPQNKYFTGFIWGGVVCLF